MTQSYNTLNETDELVDSREVINNNILTALTSSASSTVPTTNVEDGRPFYNNNSDMLYMRSKNAWKVLFDCSGSIPKAGDSSRLGGSDATTFPKKSSKNIYTQNQVLSNNRALAIKNTYGTELNVVYLNSNNSLQFGNTTVTPTIYYPNGQYPLVNNGSSSYKIYHEGNPPPTETAGDHNHDSDYLKLDGIAKDAFTSRKLFNKSLWSTGNNYDTVTYVKTDGSLAIGTNILFHESSADSKDWSAKISQVYDNSTYPASGILIEPGSTTQTISTKLRMVVGDFQGDYASILAINEANASAKLQLGTLGTGGTTNAINISNYDTPDLAPGAVLTYARDLLPAVPVMEAYHIGANGASFLSYTNDGTQTGFQILTGDTDGAYSGFKTFVNLISISHAFVCPIQLTGNNVVAHVTAIDGNTVHYHCSAIGIDNVSIIVFGDK
jgi:hypothetical protein